MTENDCQRYLEDPEKYAEHLASCEACSAMEADLDQPLLTRPLALEDLPLASWEGAQYRAWPLVIIGAAVVLALALLLFVLAGVSPAVVITANLPLIGAVPTVVRLMTAAVQQVSPLMQVILLVAFVVINTLFFVLLRRAPRGLDV